MILPAEVGALIEALQREVAELRRENEALRAENADLRRRLDLDSSTSSKPPSSDGLRKKPVSLREPSGRPSGGQKGHKGETLRQVAEPDRIVTHEAFACRHCGCALTPAMAAGMERRQVFDPPERLIEVTEHQGLVYACPGCGGRPRAAFPAEARGPAQYGGRVRALAVYPHAQQLIPEDRTAETLNLLLRLHRFKDDVLRFLVDFDVPFTNNLAEQALRMMKVKMKISGAFRTLKGAQAFVALRSVIATARKQRKTILQALAVDPTVLANAIAA